MHVEVEGLEFAVLEEAGILLSHGVGHREDADLVLARAGTGLRFDQSHAGAVVFGNVGQILLHFQQDQGQDICRRNLGHGQLTGDDRGALDRDDPLADLDAAFLDQFIDREGQRAAVQDQPFLDSAFRSGNGKRRIDLQDPILIAANDEVDRTLADIDGKNLSRTHVRHLLYWYFSSTNNLTLWRG